jgi:hypothetical protein
MKAYIFFVLLFLVSKNILFTQNIANIPRSYAIIQNLKDEWQVYDAKYGAYIPYLAERHKVINYISFWLDTQFYKDYELLLYAPQNTSIFFHQKLGFQTQKEGWVSFKIDSLHKKYPYSKIFITIYDDKKRLPLPHTYIVTKFQTENQNKSVELKRNALERQARPNEHKNFVILMAVFLLFFYTLIWNLYPKSLQSYMSLKSSLSPLARKDMNLIHKPLNSTNFVLIFAHLLLLSYIYAMYQLVINKFEIGLGQGEGALGMILGYLQILGNIILVLVIKYLSIYFSGTLLGTQRLIANTHFFEYVRLSMLFYTGICFLPIYIWFAQPHLLLDFMIFFKYLVLFFHIFQGILVGNYIFQRVEYKNLYLFYYLCTTELVPLLIGIKLLFITN